jgi:hypothetical protein
MKNSKDIISATILIVVLTFTTGCALTITRNYYHNSTIYKLKKYESQFYASYYLIEKWQ